MAEAQEKPREIPYVAAIADGLRAVMREQPDAFIAGEDVAEAGGVYGYFQGLLKEFGPDRVVDTPISEEGIVGLGVGAAATGCRPIIDVMFMDFMGECMDEITNQLAKMRYMFGGRATLPVTVLSMAGAGANLAAQHSQSLEAWICHVPGLKVTMASTPYDAKGLIIGAARDDNPVFVILNKMSLAMMGHVPEEPYAIPLGEANIVREGTNYTIIAFGRMVHEALAAAEELTKLGIDAEVIDPRTLQPFDTDTAVASMKKTHRASRARGGAFRRLRRRNRRATAGTGLRLSRCAHRPGGCAVLAGTLQPRAGIALRSQRRPHRGGGEETARPVVAPEFRSRHAHGRPTRGSAWHGRQSGVRKGRAPPRRPARCSTTRKNGPMGRVPPAPLRRRPGIAYLAIPQYRCRRARGPGQPQDPRRHGRPPPG